MAASRSCRAMSVSQVAGLCAQNGSGLVPAGGEIWVRLTVDAVAPNPHRDGVSQASCSRPALPDSAMTPPERMICTIDTSTSSGIVFFGPVAHAEVGKARGRRPEVSEAAAGAQHQKIVTHVQVSNAVRDHDHRAA